MTSATFGVEPDQLRTLLDGDAPALLKSLGGPKGLATKLRSSLTHGLEDDAATLEQRKRIFAVNQLPETEEATFMDMVKESLEDRMVQILIVSAVISLTLGLTVPDPVSGVVDYAYGWLEGAAILLSVTLVTLVSSVNNYQKEQKFKELAKSAPPIMVNVVRGGKTVQLSDRELLSGDLLTVVGGDVLTVDGVVLRSTTLKVDESSATGENDDVEKSSKGDCVVRSGSAVVEGEATVLVTGVGIHSFAGHIAMQVREAKEETPLQEKLTDLADLIGYFGMVAAALMLLLLSLRDLYETYVLHAHPFNYKKYLDNLTTAVTIVVVAVPEGLPLSVTIALAYSMKQMFKENNLVRHLAACETMGSATTICTDKTGTITQNKMTVTEGTMPFGTAFTVPLQDAPRTTSPVTETATPTTHKAATVGSLLGESEATAPKAMRAVRALLMEGLAVNGRAERHDVVDALTGERGVKFTGNKTEQALLSFVHRLGLDPMQLRAATLMRASDAEAKSPTSATIPVMQDNWPAASTVFSKKVHVYPFSSARKRMTTAIVLEKEEMVRFHVKGASELLLSECTHTFSESGARVPLSHDTRVALENAIFDMARRRLRTLAVAYTEAPCSDAAHFEFPESDAALTGLTLLGIVGIRDPVRDGVPEAIAHCRKAGVLVRMITGDNKATAISISREVGIYGPVWSGPDAGRQGLALEGHQFREFAKSERKLNMILPRLQVIARASPLDKQILVSALMKRGEVVAVTGDGTNDAPALKNANVGFSMNSGTEVAKNASDVVILDDNFSTIVTAMKWGRNVNDNIAKFLQFQMTVNVAAVVVSFLGALMDAEGESPLKPVQLLWLNLIMDTLAALALATESPTERVLDRAPKPKNAPLITNRMWVNIIGQSLYQIVLQLWVLNSGYRYFQVERNSPTHLSIIFNIFVLLQLFNEFNARILDRTLFVFSGIQHAPLFLLVVGSCLVVQVLGVQFGGALMSAVPLSATHWQQCLKLSIAPLPIGFFLRLLPVHESEVPPPPPVVDPEEEKAIASAHKAGRGAPVTLKDAARKVILQLRVVRALKAAPRAEL